MKEIDKNTKKENNSKVKLLIKDYSVDYLGIQTKLDGYIGSLVIDIHNTAAV